MLGHCRCIPPSCCDLKASTYRLELEEKYGVGIQSRCRQALMHYMPLAAADGIEIHQHDTLYNSIYIGDYTMVVNMHRFGITDPAEPDGLPLHPTQRLRHYLEHRSEPYLW